MLYITVLFILVAAVCFGYAYYLDRKGSSENYVVVLPISIGVFFLVLTGLIWLAYLFFMILQANGVM